MQWKRGIVRLNVDVDVKASAKVNDERWTTDNGRQSTTDSSSSSTRPLHTHIRFDENGNAPSPATSSTPTPTAGARIPAGKVTSKMRERAEYERQLAEGGDSSDEDAEYSAARRMLVRLSRKH